MSLALAFEKTLETYEAVAKVMKTVTTMEMEQAMLLGGRGGSGEVRRRSERS